MSSPYPIKKLEQFRALTSSVRGDIIDIVNLMGPSSAFEIADSMGRPVDSLYYHIRKLVKVGLLVVVDRRKARRQIEEVFDLPGRPMYLEYDPANDKYTNEVMKSISAMLRSTERNFKKAFDKEIVYRTKKHRNIEHNISLGWFTEREIQEVRARIRKLIDDFYSSAKTRRKNSKLFGLTVMLTPIEVNKRR